MKYLFGVFFVVFFCISVKSQVASDWENYTDMKTVNAAVASSNGIWAASNGGGFFYNFAADSFKTFHKADGMSGQIITAVTIDNYGKIWFGSTEGAIDVYNPATNSFISILDIENSNYNSKQITNLQTSGDTIFISTSYGISLISSKNLTFYDTYFRFGNFPSNIQVNSVVKSNLIYAATTNGVAIQKVGAVNLSAPESWNVYTTANGLPSNTVNNILFFNGTMTVATSNGLSQFDGNIWKNFIPTLQGDSIADIVSSGDTLFILANNQIYSYVNGILTIIYSSPYPLISINYSNKFGVIATSSKGIIFGNNFSLNTFKHPNCPESNQFLSMAVDNNGTLWCASGSDPNGKGFYKFDGKNWSNYNTSNDSSLPNNFFFSVYAAPDNTIYFGDWKSGFIKIKDNLITHYDTTNTGMKGIQKNANYLVISSFTTDANNNLWVLNYGAVNNLALNLLTTNNVWYNYFVPSMGYQYLEGNQNLVIDPYGTKWFSSSAPSKPGLYYFNENNTYSNLSDDKYGYLSVNDGLNTNSISSVVVDARGDVWVGTSLGVNIISNTSSIVSGSSPAFSISSVFTLREQTINCIAVDPLNQKWVGTNQGLLLVSSDGTSLLASYNAENSPLLNDQIQSLAIDKNSGIVYVGTEGGLTSFKTSAIQPQESFTKLIIYPSPFVLKSSSNHLTIDGLVQGCSIKILSVSGKLIKQFDSPGGRVAYWDGTDNSGNLVSTGVYLVVAYNQDGSSVFTGKIAVIHK
jgi:ligand-binding sensor domain-containing protein